MIYFQTGTILLIGLIYLITIFLFCRSFTKNRNIGLLLIIPVSLFVLGYLFRINGNEWQIDLGFFLTDSSSIFLYALFTGALILGQMKFWKK